MIELRQRSNRLRSELRQVRKLVALSRREGPNVPALRRRGAVAWAVVALAVIPAILVGSVFLWKQVAILLAPLPSVLPTVSVKRAPFDVRITERGELESGKNVTLRCQVEGGGGTTILNLAEEGTLVEKDQVLVELDSSKLQSEAAKAHIRLESAIAALKSSQTRAVVQILRNESNIAAAELRLMVARLELQKYLNGDFVIRRTKILGDLQFAEENLQTAHERSSQTAALMQKGYATSKELVTNRLGETKARIAYEIADMRRRLFFQFSHRRDLAEREANVRRWTAEADRVKLRAQAATTQREVDLLARKRTVTIETQRYEKLQKQIAACTIRTPCAGTVVYANSANAGRASPEPLIYQGAKVRERQPLVHLPDVTHMQVQARVHESKVLQLREGMAAEIRLDALSGQSFHGIVEKVADVPISASWPKIDLKEYATVIRITDEPEKVRTLKPGLTAEVEILADHLASVLQLPLQSLVRRGGRYFAWVQQPEQEPGRREVRVGRMSDQAMEVIEGVAEGDEVILNPRLSLPDAVALLQQDVPEEFEAEGAPAEPPSDEYGPMPDFVEPAAEESAEEKPADPMPTVADERAPLAGVSQKEAVALFDRMDQNADSKVTRQELPPMFKPMFNLIDTNGDHVIDRGEWKKGTKVLSESVESRTGLGGGE